MATPSYEVEIKCLLGGQAEAEELIERMRERDPKMIHLGSHSQLNHYFTGGDLKLLSERLEKFMTASRRKELEGLASRARDFSLRTRLAETKVFLVVKAAVDDTTSANGTARVEFEAKTPKLSLKELDGLILECGFGYQSKWSRERAEYKFLDVKAAIDRNAGYGYLAEFEVSETDASKLDETKSRLRRLIRELGVEELPQDRLERMFAFYNAHWQEYYGTEKVFTLS